MDRSGCMCAECARSFFIAGSFPPAPLGEAMQEDGDAVLVKEVKNSIPRLADL